MHDPTDAQIDRIGSPSVRPAHAVLSLARMARRSLCLGVGLQSDERFATQWITWSASALRRDAHLVSPA